MLNSNLWINIGYILSVYIKNLPIRLICLLICDPIHLNKYKMGVMLMKKVVTLILILIILGTTLNGSSIYASGKGEKIIFSGTPGTDAPNSLLDEVEA